jgi:hypothetical protein
MIWIMWMHDIVCTGDLCTKGVPIYQTPKSNTYAAETHRKERKKAQKIPKEGGLTQITNAHIKTETH